MARWLLLLWHLAAAAAPPRKVLLPQQVADRFSSKCLDSSSAGYYIREQSPDNWIIMLDGGGLCIDALDCRARAKGLQGSSTNWPTTWDPQAVPFSESSFFRNFSQVFVPYCSGDLWLGKDTAKRLLIGELQMSGHFILDAVVEHLFNTTALRRSSLLVFSGQSAGGIGVFHHADWISQKLAALGSSPSRVVAAPTGGLFFPQKWPVMWEEFRIGLHVPVDGFMASWCHLLEGSFMHEGCVAAAKQHGTPVRDCQDVSKILPVLKAETFIFQNQFDQYQINYLGLCPSSRCNPQTPPTSTAGEYLAMMGNVTNATLQAAIARRPDFGVLVPSWFDHTTQLMATVAGEGTVAGWSFSDAFGAWLQGKAVHVFEGACHGGPCPIAQPDTVVV
ncbi:unnamed protein product [Effrenium voratum]|nr:unnamed protein product [Effrenium voratum]|mmetsp:Transcript_136426/g.323093  ORF Transcript_136426/g.323093 Transcript_136426/m.323093 type:complete len:390 (+) Transcript_136426:141-1310(+)|eukprot:CAMPEP_0181428676 /NCGR_PEP_ID=MMETSP1110-20121109/16802_1 /TAXON_ID=174948 /ORGANISM="Symbiodinium sp., Strain CCMP421" /LENGTH=389 /DNA_ID=CAMNT_0023551911 /DNA_START=131 /DNA_END=1300 /DNA_ORIENTATION=+